MLPSERYDLLLQKLSEQEMMTIAEMMETFNISIETVRRDLNHLEKEKKIKRVYGGAILNNNTMGGTSGNYRLSENIAEKTAIGRECAKLINDGDTLYLGPGTTVLQVAKNLKNFKNLTVLTDSFYTAMELMDSTINLYFIGGQVNKPDCNISHRIPDNAWEFFRASKAIIGAGGISFDCGITDYDIAESLGIQKILKQAIKTIVVVDNSKFGVVYNCSTCTLEKVDHIVTDSAQKEKILQEFSIYRPKLVFTDTDSK